MKKKSIRTLCVLLAAGATALLLWQGRQKTLQNQMKAGTTFAMNTVIEQKWFGPNAEETYLDANAAIAEIEAALSMHLPNSEIARLNQNAGVAPVELSERTYALLAQAKQLSLASQQAFDITIAPVVELWGITGENPHVPTDEELACALALMGLSELALDPAAHTAYLPRAGMAIDLGGIAKGWACDQLRDLALQNGITSGYVSLGGNLMIIGDKPDGTPFKFGLRNPLGDASEYVGILTLKDKTMATTGGYERFFIQDGVRYHHVLDSRTGYPAASDLLSVSVISENGILADFLSTTLFVQGREAALAALDDERFELVVIDDAGNLYVSPSLQPYFTPNPQAEGFTFTDYSDTIIKGGAQ